MTAPRPTLRERQSAETWLSIHHAAVELVRSHGLQRSTVQAIAARADVAPRTFFNYFPTKEDAILGLGVPEVPQQALTAFREDTGGRAFDRLVRLLLAVVQSALRPEIPFEERQELMRAHPELHQRLMAHVTSAETLVHELLSDQGDGSPLIELSELGLPQTVRTARALLMIAGTILRFAYISDPGAALADTDATVDNAIATFREVLEATL